MVLDNRLGFKTSTTKPILNFSLTWFSTTTLAVKSSRWFGHFTVESSSLSIGTERVCNVCGTVRLAQRSGMSAGSDSGARLNQFKNKGKDANVSSARDHWHKTTLAIVMVAVRGVLFSAYTGLQIDKTFVGVDIFRS